jgi:hypothetical protein
MHLFCLPRRFLLTCSLLAIPCSAVAQDWTMPWSDPRDRPGRVDVTVTGGYVMPTDWSDLVVLGSTSATTGVFEQVLLRDLRVEPGPVLGASATYWKAQYGFRVSVARSDSSLVSSGTTLTDVDSWFYDVRGAIGMLEYTPTRNALPYFFIGLGAITYDLSQPISPPLTTFIERQPSPPLANPIIIDRAGQQFLLEVDELGMETVFAFTIGIGTDFRIPAGAGGLGLRVEVADHISPSPIGVRLHNINRFGEPTTPISIGVDAVHHLRASAGLVFQFGR